jgi:hypothetical protein
MAEVPICGDEDIESCGFGGVEQLSVPEGVPPMQAGLLDDVS